MVVCRYKRRYMKIDIGLKSFINNDMSPLFESSSGHHLFSREHAETIDKTAEICHSVLGSVPVEFKLASSSSPRSLS